jgi:hypothetical protein
VVARIRVVSTTRMRKLRSSNHRRIKPRRFWNIYFCGGGLENFGAAGQLDWPQPPTAQQGKTANQTELSHRLGNEAVTSRFRQVRSALLHRYFNGERGIFRHSLPPNPYLAYLLDH